MVNQVKESMFLRESEVKELVQTVKDSLYKIKENLLNSITQIFISSKIHRIIPQLITTHKFLRITY